MSDPGAEGTTSADPPLAAAATTPGTAAPATAPVAAAPAVAATPAATTPTASAPSTTPAVAGAAGQDDRTLLEVSDLRVWFPITEGLISLLRERLSPGALTDTSLFG